MKTHGRMLPALLIVGLGSLLLARAAAAEDEAVVHDKRPIVVVELDRTPLRIDMERYRQNLRSSLERALAGEPPSRIPADRVAVAEPRPHG